MKFKTTTQARNRKAIIVYYALAPIFVSIGLFTQNAQWYVIAIVFLGLALVRKHWLMKRLKK